MFIAYSINDILYKCFLKYLSLSSVNRQRFTISFCTTLLFQIRHPLDETQCVHCPEGTVPDPAKQICLEIPEVFLRAESAWAIGELFGKLAHFLVNL